MATGEALAHLHYLVEGDEMLADSRDDAVWYQTK
jgi:hypothetical protein